MNKRIIRRFLTISIIILIIFIGCAGNKKSVFQSSDTGISAPTEVGDIQYGMCSYYAEKFHGRRTANGEIYDMYGLSAAHQTLPLNSIVRVTNLENNKILELKINDRGPFIKDRILDCSYGAAVKLGFISKGTTMVKVELLEIGDDIYRKE